LSLKIFQILISSDAAELLKTKYEEALVAYANTFLPQPVVPHEKESVQSQNTDNVESEIVPAE